MKKPLKDLWEVFPTIEAYLYLSFIVVLLSIFFIERNKGSRPEVLYRDGIMPAVFSDSDCVGEVTSITTPIASKTAILTVRRSTPPDEEIFFAFGDETMQVGDKVQLKMFRHVPHEQSEKIYYVWLATKLGTNQVAEKK